jgi:hypothetical protein
MQTVLYNTMNHYIRAHVMGCCTAIAHCLIEKNEIAEVRLTNNFHEQVNELT